MPIWIADYVLISYGTGAIMAVPAHDERDFEFAQQFNLPIIAVVDPGDARAAGRARRSPRRQAVLRRRRRRPSTPASTTASPTAEFKKQITADLAANGVGREAVNYKLRDWLFSRQRFWGEPFPILHELDAAGKPTGRVRAVARRAPAGRPAAPRRLQAARPPRAAARQGARRVALPGDRRHALQARNEHDAAVGRLAAGTTCGSSIRRTPRRRSIPRSKRPGCRSTSTSAAPSTRCCTCLYSRFWHKVLFDRGVVSTPEPFQKLVNQGMILGENNEKMSKSRGNVINPDDVVKEYGADSLRLYEMFMGPLEAHEALEHAGRQRRPQLSRPRRGG